MKDTFLTEMESVENENSWKDKLITEKGKIIKCPENIITMLENIPQYAGKLKYNNYDRNKEYDGKIFDDLMQSVVNNDVFRNLGFYNQSMTSTALDEVFTRHRYNPVADYLWSLKWDGKKRIETLMIDMLGADDTELNRTMTRKWMVAAVKRTIHPGCKFDNVIVLQGAGGIGKSTLCERLAKQFFSEISLCEIDSKDIVHKMNRTWIAIIDEMDNMNRKEMSSIKSFLSRTKEVTRLAYAKVPENYERHCVFIGSINDETFLRDSTSNVERRFWVIKCNNKTRGKDVYEKMTDEYVDQLWAEAMNLYAENPDQYLDLEPELYEAFEKEQRQFKTYNDDDVIDFIKETLDKKYRINKEGEVTRLEQLQDDLAIGDKFYIDKIKGRTLTELIFQEAGKLIGGKPRGRQYLKTALEGEWEYKDTWFKSENKTMKAWVRVSPKNSSSLESLAKKAYDPMEEFNFGIKMMQNNTL